MEYLTGQTIYATFVSVDANNVPVASPSLDYDLIKDGSIYLGQTITISTTDAATGLYTASFSSSTEGSYQIYIMNNTTNTVAISHAFLVKNQPSVPTIYVGL
jgi:hypothetical protein